MNSVVENPDGSISFVHDPSKVNLPVEGAMAAVSGTVDVSNPEGMGGQINVLGQNVALINAQLNASGGGGGGTILAGGDYLGGTAGTDRMDSSLNAQNLFVDSNTVMNADAVIQGNGGTVINWADNNTVFNGTITARGGALGGDGGFVETSGKNVLQIGEAARVNAGSVAGENGTWLLDPLNINIANTGGTITPGTIEASLDGGTNVVLTTDQPGAQDGDITLTDSINQTGGGTASLTLTGRQFLLSGTPTISMTSTGGLTFNLNVVNPESTPATSNIQNAHNAIGTVAGTRTINLGAGTYQGTTSQLLLLSKNVTINGQGAANTILSGENARQVVINIGSTVNINDLSITGGVGTQGGGIVNFSGTVNITNSTISNNRSTNSGGGITNSSGIVSITNSTISGNKASTGGGILNAGGAANLTITNSTISDNEATNQGGGIDNNRTVTITNSTISGNKVTGTNPFASNSGGGIFSSGGTLNITNSTINGNTATGSGGGISRSGGTVDITNSTISGNATQNAGGGINNSGGTVNITSSTISGNTAALLGGGVYNAGVAEENITNSIISGNTCNFVTCDPEIAGTNGQTLNFFGNNLLGQSGMKGISDFNGTINNPENFFTPAVATNQILAPLADNGGPTQTHALLPSSPALGVGDASLLGGLTTDQRGLPRLRDGLLDLGAFQLQESPPPVSPSNPPLMTPATPPVVTPSSTPPVVVTPNPTPPPTPQVMPPVMPPTLVFVPAPVELTFPQELLTILQGQEQPPLPLEQDLCTFAGGSESPLDIDGVPVESALAEQCR